VTSVAGTNRIIGDVRCSVAIGVKPAGTHSPNSVEIAPLPTSRLQSRTDEELFKKGCNPDGSPHSCALGCGRPQKHGRSVSELAGCGFAFNPPERTWARIRHRAAIRLPAPG
jgi:hypothetical protein